MPDGTRLWHGGVTSDEISKMESDRIGIGHWAQEGIAARGVLIDYVSYAEKKGMYADRSGSPYLLSASQQLRLAISPHKPIDLPPYYSCWLHCDLTLYS